MHIVILTVHLLKFFDCLQKDMTYGNILFPLDKYVVYYARDTAANTTKLRGLSPRANYTDRATASCWRS
jgi:hypothetical protein